MSLGHSDSDDTDDFSEFLDSPTLTASTSHDGVLSLSASPERFAHGPNPLSAEMLHGSLDSTGTNNLPVRLHEKYYFHDGSALFLLDDLLYNLHRSLLAQHAPGLHDLLIQPADALPEGWELHTGPAGARAFVNFTAQCIAFDAPRTIDSATGATVLTGVSVDEFDSFLSVLYPADPGALDLTHAQWTAVLSLSTRFAAPALHALALRRLSALLPVESAPLERLLLARAHDVHSWAEGALLCLCRRRAPLGAHEVSRMAPGDVALVAAVREGHGRGSSQERMWAWLTSRGSGDAGTEAEGPCASDVGAEDTRSGQTEGPVCAGGHEDRKRPRGVRFSAPAVRRTEIDSTEGLRTPLDTPPSTKEREGGPPAASTHTVTPVPGPASDARFSPLPNIERQWPEPTPRLSRPKLNVSDEASRTVDAGIDEASWLASAGAGEAGPRLHDAARTDSPAWPPRLADSRTIRRLSLPPALADGRYPLRVFTHRERGTAAGPRDLTASPAAAFVPRMRPPLPVAPRPWDCDSVC
ncbi:hypothetical protein K488DRAFT_84734 [Vararia minispora EC-137]|uniref:Uncharacterized protein n=1 Tax=Vararia minispora EC-137 TaxID=1314806 RepID=A0ACB8QPY9_9AGAM|nr:hypothetical protein K488DRAFT_84734 [Vararia minispora EC-137]